LLQNLGYELPADYLERNLRYYLARTSHGSTLSRLVHGKLGLMAGDPDLGRALYFDALASDYIDIQGGTTAEGIHAGVMCGTLFEAMTTFGGLMIRETDVVVNPQLPCGWEGIRFRVEFRGAEFGVNEKKTACPE
jgi:trehalose/maltose hydrolase-like predicted phosphorylase